MFHRLEVLIDCLSIVKHCVILWICEHCSFSMLFPCLLICFPSFVIPPAIQEAFQIKWCEGNLQYATQLFKNEDTLCSWSASIICLSTCFFRSSLLISLVFHIFVVSEQKQYLKAVLHFPQDERLECVQSM